MFVITDKVLLFPIVADVGVLVLPNTLPVVLRADAGSLSEVVVTTLAGAATLKREVLLSSNLAHFP